MKNHNYLEVLVAEEQQYQVGACPLLAYIEVSALQSVGIVGVEVVLVVHLHKTTEWVTPI